MSSGLEQVRHCRQNVDLAAVLGQATQPGLLKAELVFDHSERVLDLGADMGLLQAEACG